MPNISLADAMQNYAERQVEAGVYANLSEVVRAGLRKLMDEDGATAFYLLPEIWPKLLLGRPRPKTCENLCWMIWAKARCPCA